MTVPKTPVSVNAGPAGSFSWKGLNWTTRSGGAGGPGVSAWLPANVVHNPDGTLTFRLTPAGGCQITSTRAGFGYGDYWIVIDTPLNNMGHGVTWGSLFTYDNGEPSGSHNEIDVQETGAWGGSQVNTTPHHWGAGTSDLQYGSSFPAPAGPLCSHMRWEPGKITYWSYAGLDDSAPLIKQTITTTQIPTPRQENLMINLWQFKGGIQPIDITVRDFAFVPQGTPASPPPNPTPAPVPSPSLPADLAPASGATLPQVVTTVNQMLAYLRAKG